MGPQRPRRLNFSGMPQMRIIRFSDLSETPWKNGGGITRNIALHEDELGLQWRLSMADVASAGPFSRFDGLTRILTVIKGSGMTLHSEGQVWPADYAVPVTFDGGAPVNATLAQGPVRDFNLMFDSARYDGTATCITGVATGQLGIAGQSAILHVIAGTVALGPERLDTGDTVISDTAPLAYAQEENACALLITLEPRS